MRVKQIMYAISLALLLPNITCAQQVTLGNAIQIAIANRHMLFKNLFKCNVVASFSSGVVGIVSAILLFVHSKHSSPDNPLPAE